MIKNDQVTFKQLPPPILSKIFSIMQPQTELIYEHWRYLMSACEAQTIVNGQPIRNAYMVYKSKFSIGFLNFQDGCLLYQRKFKIMHAQSQEITAIKMHTINIKYEQNKKKEVLVALGFFDGSCEIYNLNITQKSVILNKLLFLENSGLKEPVTSFVFQRKNLFISRLHSVMIYKDVLTATANIIIQDEIAKERRRQTAYKFIIEQLPMQNLVTGSTITIIAGLNNLYAFNETEGARSFDYQSIKINGSIIDSLVFVKQVHGQNLVLGDASNYLKVIYQGKNYVERYNGFKNYCSSIDQVLFATHQEIWVGDYNGSVTYFQRYLGIDPRPPNKMIKMVEFPVKYSVRLCDNGIKEMRIIGKLLFALDTQSNIHIYDIVRKDSLQHLKTVELQSVEEYTSNDF